MSKKLHQMRINSLGVLVWDRLTWWESCVHHWKSLWHMPRRSGVVLREVSDE